MALPHTYSGGMMAEPMGYKISKNGDLNYSLYSMGDDSSTGETLLLTGTHAECVSEMMRRQGRVQIGVRHLGAGYISRQFRVDPDQKS